MPIRRLVTAFDPTTNSGAQIGPTVAAARVTGSASSAGRVRRAGHVLAAAIAWSILAALWVWQLGDYRPSRFELYPALIGLVFVVLLISGRAWIGWNRGIYRRRHTRTRALEREPDFNHDSLGRRVLCNPALRYAPGQVIVSIDAAGAKTYRPGLEVGRPDPLDAPPNTTGPATYVPRSAIEEAIEWSS